jgi:hypothetical protein
MYQFKKMLFGLGMKYEKIDACPDNCMLFLERACQREEVFKVL